MNLIATIINSITTKSAPIAKRYAYHHFSPGALTLKNSVVRKNTTTIKERNNKIKPKAFFKREDLINALIKQIAIFDIIETTNAKGTLKIRLRLYYPF